MLEKKSKKIFFINLLSLYKDNKFKYKIISIFIFYYLIDKFWIINKINEYFKIKITNLI
jgi:hypothetical protein